MLGTGPVEAVAVFINGDLRHHRQFGIDFARRQNRLVQLLEVAERLQNDEIDPFFVQGRDLFAKGFARFGEGDLAQRLDADAERADGPGHHGVEALGGLAGQTGAFAVNLGQLVNTAVFRQPKRIGAEGVCFYDLGTGLKIFQVDAPDQVGLRQVQLVVTTVNEDSFGQQKCPHGAIAEDGSFLQSSYQVGRHYALWENTVECYWNSIVNGLIRPPCEPR